MAFSKAKSFDKTLYFQSVWSKAKAHPARLIILTYLLENGITSFKILRKQIPLASTTVSQHLRLLRSLGMIEAEVKFPYTFYKLNSKICKELAIMLAELNNRFIQKISPGI